MGYGGDGKCQARQSLHGEIGRILLRTGTTLNFFLHGLGGERLMVYECTNSCDTFAEKERWIYFAGQKMFSKTGTGPLKAVTPSRLASEAKHFPYGELQGTAPTDTKDYFSTYRRDGTGLDYAWNRYYSSTMGRFTTADPYGGSASPAVPETWNRYSYVSNNPVNYADPKGLFLETYSGPGAAWIICAMNPFAAMSTNAGTCRDSPYSEEMWSIIGPQPLLDPDTSELERRWKLGGLRDALAAAAGAIVNRRRGRTLNPATTPKYLAVVGDCWRDGVPGAGSLAYTRQITYQIQDGNGNAITGLNLTHVAVFEKLLHVEGNDKAENAAATWSVSNGSIAQDGTFTDFLSVGGIPPAFPGQPWKAFQVFYVMSISRTFIPLYHPLIVRGHGFDTPALDNRYFQQTVTVNGIGFGRDPSRKCK